MDTEGAANKSQDRIRLDNNRSSVGLCNYIVLKFGIHAIRELF
jgi:hypothetical protein